MLTSVTELGRTIHDFAGIVRRAVRGRKADFTAVIGFGVLGAAAQIGAIAALLGFLRLMNRAETDGPVMWHGVEFSSGLGALMLASGVLAIMLIVAAIANYLAIRRARAIGRGCAESTTLHLFDLVDRAESMPEGMSSKELQAMGVRGSRLSGISVENTIRLIHPVIQIVALLGALFYLDWLATALFVPAMLVPIPVLWKYNRRVRESAREFYDSAAKGFGRAVGTTVEALQHAKGRSGVFKDAAIDRYRSTPEVSSFFHHYDDMQLTSSRAVLITSLFRPLIMVYVLLVLGLRVGEGGMTWPDAMGFLLVLIQVTMRLEGAVAQVSVLSRLHTQIEPLLAFESHVAAGEAAYAGRWQREPIVLHWNAIRVIGQPGSPVQFFTGRSTLRLELPGLIEDLSTHLTSGLDALRSAAFVSRRFCPNGVNGAALLTGQRNPGDDELKLVMRIAESLGVAAEVRIYAAETVTLERWGSMSPACRIVFQLGAVICDEERPVMLDIGLLTQLDRSQAETLLAEFADRIVVLLAQNYGSNCVYATDVVALVDRDIVWAGPSAAWATSDIRSSLANDTPSSSADEVDATLEEELV